MPKQTTKISVSLNRETLPLAISKEKARAKRLGYRYSLSGYIARLLLGDLNSEASENRPKIQRDANRILRSEAGAQRNESAKRKQ